MKRPASTDFPSWHHRADYGHPVQKVRQQTGDCCKKNVSGIFKDALDQVICDIRSVKRALLFAGACFFVLWLLTGSICPMHAVTGIPCPGCGLTRAGLQALTLDFAGAWRMNPFIFPIGVLILIWCIYRYLLLKKPGSWFSWCAAAVLAGW